MFCFAVHGRGVKRRNHKLELDNKQHAKDDRPVLQYRARTINNTHRCVKSLLLAQTRFSDVFWGMIFDRFVSPSLDAHDIFVLSTLKKTSGNGPHVCILSGQSSLPCLKLQQEKNIDVQSCEWSASGGAFWWLAIALRLSHG